MMESMDSRGHESGIPKGPETASLQAPSSLPRTSASTHSLPRNPLFVSRLPFASCTHLGRTRDRHREDQIPSVSGYSSLYSFVCWWDCVGSPSTHDCPHQFPPLPVGRRFFNICCAACAWERDDYNPVGGLITLAIIRRVSGWGCSARDIRPSSAGGVIPERRKDISLAAVPLTVRGRRVSLPLDHNKREEEVERARRGFSNPESRAGGGKGEGGERPQWRRNR